MKGAMTKTKIIGSVVLLAVMSSLILWRASAGRGGFHIFLPATDQNEIAVAAFEDCYRTLFDKKWEVLYVGVLGHDVSLAAAQVLQRDLGIAVRGASQAVRPGPVFRIAQLTSLWPFLNQASVAFTLSWGPWYTDGCSGTWRLRREKGRWSVVVRELDDRFAFRTVELTP
jgi:hypothetical protein